MKLGNLDIKDIYVGSTPAAQVYFGDVKVWPEEQPAGDYWGLCFTAEEPNASISMVGNGTPPVLNLLYSTNANTWSTFTPGTTTVTLANVGDKVWLKAGSGGNSGTGSSSSNYWKFSFTNHVAASGNIMSLLNGDQQTYTLQNYAFYKLFNNNTNIVDASELELPATTLTTNCYGNMFNGCSSLSSAPELPATNLAQSCYVSMFFFCTSLAQAPALPATTLAGNCYQNMFNGCIALTTAPALPATTLASACYSGMFRSCSSLTTAPALPATTLAGNCYQDMFSDCSSLTQAPVLPATNLTGAGGCYSGMFRRCTSLTQAPALPATTLAGNCYQDMFSGCSSLTQAPALPATTLAGNCYKYMFRACSSLTTAPALPATTLADYCYQWMFQYCSSLSSLSVGFTQFSNGTNGWFSDVYQAGTFYCPTALGTNETISRGSSNCPTNWTVVNTDA